MTQTARERAIALLEELNVENHIGCDDSCSKKSWEIEAILEVFSEIRKQAIEDAAKVVSEDRDVVYEGCRGNYEIDIQATMEKLAQAIRKLAWRED